MSRGLTALVLARRENRSRVARPVAGVGILTIGDTPGAQAPCIVTCVWSVPHHLSCGTTARKQSMAQQVDLASEAFFRDPSGFVATLRMMAPVVKAKFPIVGRVWITTTYETAARVLKDDATFSLRKDGAVAGLRWWMPKLVTTLANNMLSADEPDHTRLRSIVDEAFRRRAVLDMEPRIRAIADDLAGRLFAKGSPADLVTNYAQILPLAVISELLGLPEADRPTFIRWANSLARVNSAVRFLAVLHSFRKMRTYMAERLRLARE